MQRRLILTVAILASASACSKPQGSEGGPCYPNATCDEGLTCLGETCVGGGREGEGEGEGEPEPLAGVLANSQPFLASNECPTGGADVSTGIDVNANGVLEAAEVTRVVTICNGADGASALVAQEALPEGETCGAGGVRLRSGIDTDRDGVLDENEVLRSDDVCSGAAGAPGATTRVVLSEVAAGERCPAGGIHFTAGLDVNGDGSLSAGEVQQEAIVCNGVPGTSCTVTRDDLAGTTTVVCEDGTSAVMNDGTDCTTTRDEVAGTSTIRCDDGTVATVHDGATGAAGTSCAVSRDSNAGTTTVRCADGTEAVIPDGRNGADGTSCTVARDDVAGTTAIVCEDGTSAVIADGTDCTTTRDEVAGTSTILCEDGTTAVVSDGATGERGASCTVNRDEIAGTTTVRCEDGTTAVIPDGRNGNDCSASRDDAAGTTTVTCGGAVAAVIHDGQRGEQGLSALVKTTDEPAGSNCRRGGTRVDVGIDDDRDGTLDTIEIDDTSFICGLDVPCDVVHGGVAIYNDIELAMYAGCKEITGQLVIAASTGIGGVTTLEPLSALRRVGGNLSINGHVALSNLEGLRSLEEVGGDLSVYNNTGLSTLAGLRSLRRVGGGAFFQQLPDMISFSGLAGLETVGGTLAFTSTYSGTSLNELSSLQSTGDLIIQETNITSVSFPALRSVSGLFRIQRVPGLPDSAAQALRAQLVAPFPVSTVICGTLGGASCP